MLSKPQEVAVVNIRSMREKIVEGRKNKVQVRSVNNIDLNVTMLYFTALNEDPKVSSGNETDDDAVQWKQTRESLEGDAATLYNKALALICEEKNEEAMEILEGLLDSAFLNDDEDKSPLQIQIRRGCLKNLSIIYSGDPEKLESAQRVLMEAVELDQKNVTLWTRLGGVNLKLRNFSEAYFDYAQGLKCSPYHWICIENLVNLAYILGDNVSCLYYCAYGLEKDASFLRGAVFRDAILEDSPFMLEVAKTAIDNWESLLTKCPYELKWRTKYITEADALISSRQIDLKEIRKFEVEKPKTIQPVDKIHSFSWKELLKFLLSLHDHMAKSEEWTSLDQVDMSACVLESNGIETEEESDLEVCKKIDLMDETSTSSVLRGRSGSDEKDAEKTNGAQSNGTSDFTQLDEECSQSQQSQDVQEPETKKKSRKDVKWWQLEGKRRSQRVRGHLMPVSQSTCKSERGFAETLKDLIPSSLSCAEPEKDGNTAKQTSETEEDSYFGTQAEVEDVKKFLNSHGKKSVVAVLTEVISCFCGLARKNWPAELVNSYLECCRHYRTCRQGQNEWLPEGSNSISLLKQEALIVLSIVELRLDGSTPGNIEQLKYDRSFVSDLSYLDIVSRNGLLNDKLFQVRYQWFKVIYELALAQVGLGKYAYGLHYLKMLENLLEQNAGIAISLPTKVDNMVSLDGVRKKIRFVKKMENISRISELHQNQDYESLIEILQLCLTSDDSTSTDMMNRLYLAEAYFHVQNFNDCLTQCVKIIGPSLKSRNDQALSGSLSLIEKVCDVHGKGKLTEISMSKKRIITNAMIDILTWNENKGSVPEAILISPWCILHSMLFSLEVQEPALYLDEESTPNSVVLLQFAHEFLNRSNKCTVCDGKLLTYTLDALLPIRDSDEYGAYEETKNCIEQAIFCLYSHPNKKSKIKYLVDHNTPGIQLQWSRCVQLYEYYKPERIPEFDSYETIGSDVEALFQRILTIMPTELKPTSENHEEIKQVLEGVQKEIRDHMAPKFPREFIDVYYLLGDHYFKTKEWTKSVEYYTYDLVVFPCRFDSWAAIALARAEMISSKLNACEDYNIEDVVANVDVVINCFRRALDLEPNNHKIRIEFGSFVYAMFSFCSRILKQDTDSCGLETRKMLQMKKETFLKAAHKCFEPMAKSSDMAECDDEDTQNEMWIHHYMLGKILEKINRDDPEKYLAQYELAGKLIHEQGGMYPAKINYYKPPDLAVEALEIYYRIHASIISYVQRHYYDEEKEKLLLGYADRAASGPFMKSKHTRNAGGENAEGRRKANDEAKKAEIKSLMEEMLEKVEQMVEKESSNSSTTTSDNEDDDNTSVTSSQASTLCSSDDEASQAELPPINKPVMSSFGLSAFQEKMREKEIQDSKKASLQELQTAKVKEEEKPEVKKEDKKEHVSKILVGIEDNKFYKDFHESKYGKLVCVCLTAMEECISRFPQHHKAYFVVSHTYSTLAKERYKMAKEYLVGNPPSDRKKLCGLFSDRKTNNFFNGVWRNPVDDVDRPGSFPYHMSKTVRHLLNVLRKLSDHQLLAEVGIALSKVPEQDKQYLFNSDRLLYSQLAFRYCVIAAKQFWAATSDIKEAGISIFETYQKLQKFNAKENVLSNILVDCYRQYLERFGQVIEPSLQPSILTLEQAFKFFQHLTWASKTNLGKASGGKHVAGGSASGVSAQGSSDTSSVFKQGQMNHGGNGTKNSEARKKKESSGRLERQVSREHTELPTASLSLYKIEESLREGESRPPKRKKSTGDIPSSRMVLNRPQLLPQDDLKASKDSCASTIPVDKFWNVGSANTEYLKPLMGDLKTSEPKIIDLSGNYSSPLKRKAEQDVDPFALTQPKKSAVENRDQSLSLPERGKIVQSDLVKDVAGKISITSLPKIIPTGGMPFDVFMSYVNKGAEELAGHRTSSTTGDQSKQISSASSNSLLSLQKHPPHSSHAPNFSLQGGPSKSIQVRTSYPKSLPQSLQRDVGEKMQKGAPMKTTSATSFQPQAKVIPPANNPFLTSRNTSPFRAQSTILLNPSADARGGLGGRNSLDITGLPPPAHSSRSRTPSERSSGDEPEIIDLTTPPRKSDTVGTSRVPNQSGSTTQSSSNVRKEAPEMYFVPRASSSGNYPMPPKKNIQARKSNISESSEDLEVIMLE